MWKSCSRCGKLHPHGYVCTKGKQFRGGDERKLRQKAICKAKMAEIKERANGLCEVCRDNGRFVYEGLEVHHIEKLKDRPDLYIDDENLICLCTTCHKKADSGELDKDYLRQLARQRDER